MKPLYPIRRQFRPKTKDTNAILLDKLTAEILDLKKTMDGDIKPEVHTTQREGVFYQLHERTINQVPSNPPEKLPQPSKDLHQTPSVRTRSLLGFKAFCEEMNKKAENSH